jgi:hypothetical protein
MWSRCKKSDFLLILILEPEYYVWNIFNADFSEFFSLLIGREILFMQQCLVEARCGAVG